MGFHTSRLSPTEINMQIDVTDELIAILRQIKARKLDLAGWDAVSSSDMFQSDNFCGGFEGSEGEFTFSFFTRDGDEYWFQFPLSDVPEILDGTIRSFPATKSDL